MTIFGLILVLLIVGMVAFAEWALEPGRDDE